MYLSSSEKPVKFRHGVVSNSSFAPFLFSPLVVTGKKAILLLELIMNGLDDDTYLDASPSASIGEIKFDIFHTTVPIKKTKGLDSSHFPGLPHSQKVHERSKKAIAHRVKYVASLILYNANGI